MRIEIAPLLTGIPGYSGMDGFDQALLHDDVPWRRRPKYTVDADDRALVSALLNEAVRSWRLIPLGRTDGYDLLIDQRIILADSASEAPTVLECYLTSQGAAAWYPRNLRLKEVSRSVDHRLSSGSADRLFCCLNQNVHLGGNGVDFWFEAIRSAQEIAPFLESALAG